MNLLKFCLIVINLLSPILLIKGYTCTPVSDRIASYVKAVSSDYFAEDHEILTKPLEGGYSEAVNLQLEIEGKKYVLRVNGENESVPKLNKEFFATKTAAAVGIAPTIYWQSADGYAILMDYIAGHTLTSEESTKFETMDKIATLLRAVHALPKNPFLAPSFESQMQEYYCKCAPEDDNQEIWNSALAIIMEGAAQLQKLNAPCANTHGDLNPHNILVAGKKIYFIDWGDGMYTDPFHDLAFYSIMMGYDLEEENKLLRCYLKCTPSINEKKRFLIAKKMNFARLTLSGQGIGNELHGISNRESKVFGPLKEWSYYINIFTESHTSLSPSFFWEIAQVALKLAHAIEIENGSA